VSIPRDVAAEKLAPEKKGRCYLKPAALRPGQMAYLDDGSVAFRWPAGKTPGQARIIAPPEADTSGVTIAWNGSAAGGVADVGRSVTSYRECEVHHNLGAAFYFSGRSHRVEDTLIYDQALDFAVQPGTAVERVRVTWRK
jgi:hypothetical protein